MQSFRITGGYLGIVASTRVRLARNLVGYPFHLSSLAVAKEIADKVSTTLQQAPALSTEQFSLQQITPRSAQALQLVEQHIISPTLAKSGGFVIVSQQQDISIMIGEEDHLRLQVMGQGLCPVECLARAQQLAQLLEQALPMAQNEQLGYITACPTNLGTGLRISVMLHLPMLTENGGISSVMNWAGRQGCVLRGAFGEGTQAEGNFYQLSNQVTLGVAEQTICTQLVNMAMKLVEHEQKSRQVAREQDEIGMLDRLCRAAGLLMTARRISSQQAQHCLSDVLLGLQQGILAGVTPAQIYHIAQNIRPASLALATDTANAPALRDTARATQLRTNIGCHLQIVDADTHTITHEK